MATFVGVQVPGGAKAYIRSSSVERIIAPESLHWREPATPTSPFVIQMRDGAEIKAFGNTIVEIIHAMLIENTPVVMGDGEDVGG